MSAGGGASDGIGGIDLNCETAAIFDECEDGVDDALVGTGGLVVGREKRGILEGSGDENEECGSGVDGREDGVVGDGAGSGGFFWGGKSEDGVVESHVGNLLEVDVAVESGCTVVDLGDESAGDRERGTDMVGSVEESFTVLDGCEGAESETFKRPPFFRREEIVVQVSLVDRRGQVVDGKLGLEALEAEGMSHGVKLLDVITGEKESADSVAVSAEEFEDVISEVGFDSGQKQGKDVNADSMVKDDQLGPRESEAEVKSHNMEFLEMGKGESARLVAVEFVPIEASSNAIYIHDDFCGDHQTGKTDFDEIGTDNDDELDSKKMVADGKLAELNRRVRESTELVTVSAKEFVPIKACSQPMDSESDTVQILGTDQDVKYMDEANEDFISLSGSCGGQFVASNEEKGSEELVAISTVFGPTKASSQAMDLADGSEDVLILGTYVDVKRIGDAYVNISGGICRKLLELNEEVKENVDVISTEVSEPVKSTSQSVDLTDRSGDIRMFETDVDAKIMVGVIEDAVSNSVGTGLNLLELDRDKKGNVELIDILTKIFEPVTNNNPAIDMADGSSDVPMLEIDDSVRLSEDSICISSVSGGEILNLDRDANESSELIAIPSHVLHYLGGGSQGMNLGGDSDDDEKQGTVLGSEVMVKVIDDLISTSVSKELERKDKGSTELVDVSIEVLECVKTCSPSLDLGDGSGDNQMPETDVETVVIVRNIEDSVAISGDIGEPKDERLVAVDMMEKGDLEDGKCSNSYGEGCMEVDMMEKGSTNHVASSAEWSEAVDYRASNLGGRFVDDQEEGTDVDTKGMAGTNLTVLVCGEGPGCESLELSLNLREKQKVVHVDVSNQVLDGQLCFGEREPDVEFHGEMLFEVDMGNKEKIDQVVSAEEVEHYGGSKHAMNLGNDSCGGQNEEIYVNVEGLVVNDHLGPGEMESGRTSQSRKILEVNKGLKGSAELAAFSTEALEPVLCSSHALYFGNESDGDEEGGTDLSAEAMAVDGELGREAELKSHGRNILEFDRGDKGTAELFSVSTEGYEHIKAGTEDMELGDGSVGEQRQINIVNAEAMITTDEDSIDISVVSGGSGNERLEESLVLRKKQIEVQDDLVNGSGQDIHGKLSSGKWKVGVKSNVEKHVELDMGERECTKLVLSSAEMSEITESSSQAMNLGDGSNIDKKQEIDEVADDVVGNEVSVTISVAVEVPVNERLEASLYMGKEEGEVLEHLVDDCCQVLNNEKKPGEQETELESHDGRLLEMELGENRKELITISAESFGTVNVSCEAIDMGDKSDGCQTHGVDVNVEGTVETCVDSTVTAGIEVPEHERLVESSVLETDHVEVQQESADGCNQGVESVLIRGKLLLDEKLLLVKTEEKEDAGLFAISAEGAATLEACSEAMNLKDGSRGEYKLVTDVDADFMVGTIEDSPNVSGDCYGPKDKSLEGSLILEKEHIKAHVDIVDACDQVLDDVFGLQKKEAEVELDVEEIGTELASVSAGGFYTAGDISQDRDLEGGCSSDQKHGPNIDFKSVVKTDEDFEESSVLVIDHVEVPQKSVDGCGQAVENKFIHEKLLLGEKLLEVETVVKRGADLFAISAEGSETVEMCSQAMGLKDGFGGDQKLVTNVNADFIVGTNEDSLNVSDACYGPKDGGLEGSSLLEKEDHEDLVDASDQVLDDVFGLEKREDEVELDTEEIGSAELDSVSAGGFYSVGTSNQGMDLEGGCSNDQKQEANNHFESMVRTDEDLVAFSFDGRGLDDEMLDVPSNFVKEEVQVGEETNEIGTALEDLPQPRKTKINNVDMMIHATQIQTEYGADHIQNFGAEATVGRNEEVNGTVSSGGGGAEDERLEISNILGENQVNVEEDTGLGSSKKQLTHPEKVGSGEVTVRNKLVGNLGSREGFDGDNMSESCVETDAKQSNSEPVQAKYSSSGSDMTEKVAHGYSVDAVVIEGHTCEREDEIVDVSNYNQSVVNSMFSAGDQNMTSKCSACLPECVAAANDSSTLDETVITYKKDVSFGTFQGAVLELKGGETGLAHQFMVDSNHVKVHIQPSKVENDQSICDKKNNVAGKTVQRLDSVSGSTHEMVRDVKVTVVSGNTISNCDVARTAMTLDASINAEAWSVCRHIAADNILEKGDVVLEDNSLVTSIAPAGKQNASAQQNFENQNPKEDSSSMIISFKGDGGCTPDTMEDSTSLYRIILSDSSTELENQTILSELNKFSAGCHDMQPLDIPIMKHDELEPEHCVREAIGCCQSLQDGMGEHLKESHNLGEVCNDTSTDSSYTSQQATYNLSFTEKESFSSTDLVWGKVKSHPWWPGQIFDVSCASKLALKYQKKDHFLVAYFGDKTFAWCEESRLKPFQLFFSQMEKQTNSDSFLRALHDVLIEVSRRIELSLTCLCLPEETYADIEYQQVENAGVRGKTVSSIVDRYEIVNCFHPHNLIEYVRDLAQFPNGGTNRLEITIAQAQLKSFYLFKGYTELPSFINGSGLVENDFEIPIPTVKCLEEDGLEHSATLKDLFSSKGKSRVKDGILGKQKHIVEDGRKQKSMSELMEEETTSIIVNGNENASVVPVGDERCLSSGNKRKSIGYFSNDIERIKTKKIDSLVNRDSKLPLPTFNTSFKVGEFMSRAASKLTCGQPLRKCYGEKTDGWAVDSMDIDDFLDFPFDNPKLQIDISEDYPPANEMLSKLLLVARNPLKEYNFSSIVIDFFSGFRNLRVSNFSVEMNKTEKPKAKRGRKKKVIPDLELTDTSTPDHMKDSYWSDMIVPEKDAILNPPKRRGRKKRKFISEPSLSQMLNSPSECDPQLPFGTMCPHLKQTLIAERPIIAVEEKIVDERTPTAVILYFNCSDSLPSATDLIRIFSCYGPLKEEKTSIETKTNSAMVVFKRRADAEMAFSSAGKFSTFGPALLSYRLKNFPAKSSIANITKVEDYATVNYSKLEISAEPESERAFSGDPSENIPSVQLESVDRGPSYLPQTQEDAGNTRNEIEGARRFSDQSEDLLVQTGTGIVSDNLLLESLDQELNYFDMDITEAGDVSGSTQIETGTESGGRKSSDFLPENAEISEVSHSERSLHVVTGMSVSHDDQLENRTVRQNTSQLESTDQELRTSASRDELDIARASAETSDRSSVTVDFIEILAIPEKPSSIAAQGE